MNNSKRLLFESIMCKVAPIVKQTINEIFDNGQFSNGLTKNVSVEGNIHNIDFFDDDNNEIGHAVLNMGYIDSIMSEYEDTIEDLDTDIFRRFSDVKKVCNIEDIWIDRKYRGNGHFRNVLNETLNYVIAEKGCPQIILRAYPDTNSIPEDKLVEIYKEHGFNVLQETEEDGTIMAIIK